MRCDGVVDSVDELFLDLWCGFGRTHLDCAGDVRKLILWRVWDTGGLLCTGGECSAHVDEPRVCVLSFSAVGKLAAMR